MDTFYIITRWIHIVFAAGWFGEVVVINFVLIPALSKLDRETREKVVTNLFPKIFNLASVLSLTALVSGYTLFWMLTDGDWHYFFNNGIRGKALLLGMSLGTLLVFFHFFIENQMAKKIGIVCNNSGHEMLEDIHLRLKIVPRLGLLVITTILVSMMIAARGI